MGWFELLARAVADPYPIREKNVSFFASPKARSIASASSSLLILGLCISGTSLRAQDSTSGGFAATAAAPAAPSAQVSGPLSGSVVQLKPTGDVMQLTIKDAIGLGLKYNLGLILSEQTNQQVRGARVRAL